MCKLEYEDIISLYKEEESMSRKGNSMDNGMMENFFGLLKTEMFYDQEDKYKIKRTVTCKLQITILKLETIYKLSNFLGSVQ